MVNWTRILSNSDFAQAVRKFAQGEYNCEQVQLAMRNKDREASGEMRRLIRVHGTKMARNRARKALSRRGM